jgi:hypothetical protein
MFKIGDRVEIYTINGVEHGVTEDVLGENVFVRLHGQLYARWMSQCRPLTPAELLVELSAEQALTDDKTS